MGGSTTMEKRGHHICKMVNYEVRQKITKETSSVINNSSMYGIADFDFYNLSIFAKFTLIVFMIIGRIELLTLFILFKKFLFKN